MFENDYIMREIATLSRVIAKVIFQKNISVFDMIDENGNLSDTYILSNHLDEMIRKNKINEAEDLLFKTITKNPKEQYLKIAFDFYDKLQQLPEEKLLQNGFSREEIAEGLAAVCKLYNFPVYEIEES